MIFSQKNEWLPFFMTNHRPPDKGPDNSVLCPSFPSWFAPPPQGHHHKVQLWRNPRQPTLRWQSWWSPSGGGGVHRKPLKMHSLNTIPWSFWFSSDGFSYAKKMLEHLQLNSASWICRAVADGVFCFWCFCELKQRWCWKWYCYNAVDIRNNAYHHLS